MTKIIKEIKTIQKMIRLFAFCCCGLLTIVPSNNMFPRTDHKRYLQKLLKTWLHKPLVQIWKLSSVIFKSS